MLTKQNVIAQLVVFALIEIEFHEKKSNLFNSSAKPETADKKDFGC
jgi:hypothetical protein